MPLGKVNQNPTGEAGNPPNPSEAIRAGAHGKTSTPSTTICRPFMVPVDPQLFRMNDPDDDQDNDNDGHKELDEGNGDLQPAPTMSGK